MQWLGPGNCQSSKTRTVSSLSASIKRRHCLAVVARELGFQGWPHAVGVLGGTDSTDFGTLLYPDGADAHWNIWSASYAEARAIREQHGGYLTRVSATLLHRRSALHRNARSTAGGSGLGTDRSRLGQAAASGCTRTALWQTHSATGDECQCEVVLCAAQHALEPTRLFVCGKVSLSRAAQRRSLGGL